MATKRLATELGLLRQRGSSSSGSKKQLVSNQIFSYIIVIDFESTCWKEKNNYGQEIIEFPAVLLNTSTGDVESEFHSYVQPQEHPTLSDFCTELTGITQAQVEAGLPLQICMSRFSRWLQTLRQQKGLVFPNGPHLPAPPSAPPKLCTFLTWSDWDLGVCLLYECKRKQINRPSVLNSWIDLRSSYRLFYNRKPKGLKGALQDLGIRFEGREHSGLDDARNTALLAARMTRDGCELRVTRSLDPTPNTGFKAPPAPKKPAEHDASTDGGAASKSSTSTNIHRSGFEDQTLTVNPTKSSVRSLVSPKTLLDGTVILGGGGACKTTATSTSLSAVTVTVATSDSAEWVPFVEAETAEGAVEELPVEELPVEELLVEGEERRGSYDDVVLDDVTGDFSELENSTYSSEESVKSFRTSTVNCISDKSYGNPTKQRLETCSVLSKTVDSRSCSRRDSPMTSALPKSKMSFRSFPEPRVLVPDTPSLHKPPKQSFSSFTEREDPSSSRSRSVLSDLSINAALNRTARGVARAGEWRLTSPLCSCGRRAKRQLVSNGGPNQGRAFFCCPGRRSGGGAQRGCGFFKWEAALFQRSGVGGAAAGASVSLCQNNTTVAGLPRGSLRKSF